MHAEFSSIETNAVVARTTSIATPSNRKNSFSVTDSSSSSSDLESRFERILDIVEEAGFDSIDSMAAEYYAATFKEDTMAHWAQSSSKSRYLQRLLSALHSATKNWSTEEARGYHEQIVRSAEGIYVEEIRGLKQNNMTNSHVPVPSARSDKTDRVRIGEQLAQLFQDAESSRLLKQDKKLLQQRVRYPSASLMILIVVAHVIKV